MNVLTLDAVHKSYGTKPLLEHVSFSLEHDEKMGVIGANGSGKTTLLRIAAGAEKPDGGRVFRPGATRTAYLPQNPPFDPDASVLDAVFDAGDDAMRLLHDYEAACHALDAAGGADEAALARISELGHRLDVTGGWDLEANARAVLDRLGITDTDAPMRTLSGGQRKRVALAAALVLRPDLLILDEPTNHLDADTIGWLEGYLRSFAGALLLVTHDRYFLDRVTDRMLEVERGEVQRFVGNYTAYLEQKEKQREVEEATERTRRNLARRELAWLRRGAKARTSKAKYRVERAIELQEHVGPGPQQQIELSAVASRLGKKVVEIERVSKSFDGEALLRDFSYSLTRTDRIGIIGPNGSGKTTLLEMIAGRLAPDAGRIDVGPTAVIGYYDQEARALDDDLRTIEYVEEVAEVVRTADGSLITASQMLDRFLFPPAMQRTPVGLLSGGERRRLYLLRILMGAPNVLLLDEPTNDLDIPTLIALEDYLDGFPGALLVVSHDRYFLDRTVEHLFRFEGDGRVRKIPGDYSAWLEIRAREEAEAAANAPKPEPEPAAKPEPPTDAPKKLSYKEQRELEEVEARIADAEARQAEIGAALAADPSDFEAVAALSDEMGALAAQLERDLERWADLAERA